MLHVATASRRIPDATVARLPLYHRGLLELVRLKRSTVASEELAELTGVNAAKVRKDLSYLGTYGTRGVGYDVENLLHQIGHELGLSENWPVAIIGIGNLGRALAAYGGFSARGVDASDVDATVLLNVDLRAGLRLDLLNHLAARPDDLADLLRIDLDRDDARRILRQALPDRGDRLKHLGEDMEPALASLIQDLVQILANFGEIRRIDVGVFGLAQLKSKLLFVIVHFGPRRLRASPVKGMTGN